MMVFSLYNTDTYIYVFPLAPSVSVIIKQLYMKKPVGAFHGFLEDGNRRPGPGKPVVLDVLSVK
jgi:hypothetical protein